MYGQAVSLVLPTPPKFSWVDQDISAASTHLHALYTRFGDAKNIQPYLVQLATHIVSDLSTRPAVLPGQAKAWDSYCQALKNKFGVQADQNKKFSFLFYPLFSIRLFKRQPLAIVVLAVILLIKAVTLLALLKTIAYVLLADFAWLMLSALYRYYSGSHSVARGNTNHFAWPDKIDDLEQYEAALYLNQAGYLVPVNEPPEHAIPQSTASLKALSEETKKFMRVVVPHLLVKAVENCLRYDNVANVITALGAGLPKALQAKLEEPFNYSQCVAVVLDRKEVKTIKAIKVPATLSSTVDALITATKCAPLVNSLREETRSKQVAQLDKELSQFIKTTVNINTYTPLPVASIYYAMHFSELKLKADAARECLRNLKKLILQQGPIAHIPATYLEELDIDMQQFYQARINYVLQNDDVLFTDDELRDLANRPISVRLSLNFNGSRRALNQLIAHGVYSVDDLTTIMQDNELARLVPEEIRAMCAQVLVGDNRLVVHLGPKDRSEFVEMSVRIVNGMLAGSYKTVATALVGLEKDKSLAGLLSLVQEQIRNPQFALGLAEHLGNNAKRVLGPAYTQFITAYPQFALALLPLDDEDLKYFMHLYLAGKDFRSKLAGSRRLGYISIINLNSMIRIATDLEEQDWVNILKLLEEPHLLADSFIDLRAVPKITWTSAPAQLKQVRIEGTGHLLLSNSI